jgi:hypothetical protein
MRIVFAKLLPIFLLLALPFVAKAQFTYTTNNGALTITGCPSVTGLTIPSTIDGMPVTSIAASAFKNHGNLLGVILPDTITNIGASAFFATGLTNFTFPIQVTNIQNDMFFTCGNLTNVDIPEGVASIGDFAFDDCSIMRVVNIPRSVNNIGQSAFAACSALTSISIPNSVTNIGTGIFAQCLGLTNVVIGNGVTSIGANAFSGDGSLVTITLPSTLISIGNSAFGFCQKLPKLVLGGSVTNIAVSAFQGCSKLTAIYFKGNSPFDAGSSVFSGDSTTVYYLPGATGWGASFGGRPTALWNPQVQADSSFGVKAGQFGFNLNGTTNIPVAIEAATNPASGNWTLLQTCTLTNGSVYFSDPQWTNYPSRLYRLRSP